MHAPRRWFMSGTAAPRPFQLAGWACYWTTARRCVRFVCASQGFSSVQVVRVSARPAHHPSPAACATLAAGQGSGQASVAAAQHAGAACAAVPIPPADKLRRTARQARAPAGAAVAERERAGGGLPRLTVRAVCAWSACRNAACCWLGAAAVRVALTILSCVSSIVKLLCQLRCIGTAHKLLFREHALRRSRPH